MLSAISFNLDQSKIFSSGNGLTLYTKQLCFGQVQIESICIQENICDPSCEKGPCWSSHIK